MPLARSCFTSPTRSLFTATTKSSYMSARTPKESDDNNSTANHLVMGRNPEKSEEIERRRFGDRRGVDSAQLGDFLADVTHERRLIALAAIRHRREIGTV